MKRLCLSFLACIFIFMVGVAFAEDDITKVLEKQRAELVKKEESIRHEMERLKTLKKEVEEDIVRYTRLLKDIDKSLKQAEEISNKRLKHVAKAYEAMPPEDAAKRLTGLNNNVAVQILLKMKSKKAGLVIGMMETGKATILTKELAKLRK